jgi:hypothetical protein
MSACAFSMPNDGFSRATTEKYPWLRCGGIDTRSSGSSNAPVRESTRAPVRIVDPRGHDLTISVRLVVDANGLAEGIRLSASARRQPVAQHDDPPRAWPSSPAATTAERGFHVERRRNSR